jgi:hypothetical protein
MKTIIGVIAGLVVLFFGVYFGMKFWGADEVANGEDAQTLCTMDVKLCPDGSSVGRQGPNCEFAACPNDTSDEEVFEPTAS